MEMVSSYAKKLNSLLSSFLSQIGFVILSAITTGLLVALFLWLLDSVTSLRFLNPWLLYLLPLGGAIIVFMYKIAGSILHRGNNLVIDEINGPAQEVPARITPVVLLATLITHLFGGSAGREGTAVQMGGGVAAWVSKLFSLSVAHRKLLLICGIAAGFGAVFGTPIAGAVFAVEVLKVGKFRYQSFLFCLISSVIGDLSCRLTGVAHTIYSVQFVPAVNGDIRWVSDDILLFVKVMLAGCVFGYASRLFVFLSGLVKDRLVNKIPGKLLQVIIGACIVIAISILLGTRDYLGLGVVSPVPDGVSILSSFHAGGADYLSWFWKMLLTIVTLAFGFKGGEVTPLFFIGATLGNVLAIIGGAPVDLFAALGFIAVFAGATNTPLACTIMGIELFGSDNFIFFGVACLAAFFCSGKSGIYSAQQAAQQ